MTTLGTTPDNTSCDAELEILRQEVLASLRNQTNKDPSEITVRGRQKSAFLHLRSERGSRFRGVSRNGQKWQVNNIFCITEFYLYQIMAVKGELRKYLGAINSEEQAARFYDKYLIIIQGIKVSNLNTFKPQLCQAKTNFSYTTEQAIQLLN